MRQSLAAPRRHVLVMENIPCKVTRWPVRPSSPVRFLYDAFEKAYAVHKDAVMAKTVAAAIERAESYEQDNDLDIRKCETT